MADEGGITHLVLGPAEHGVTRHALGLLVDPALADHAVVRAPTLADVDLAALPERLHLHVTDRLFGARAEEAAAALAAVVAGRRVSATLHDLPQPGDGAAYPRRVACYRVLTDVAEQVVVASAHEAALLDAADLRGPGAVSVVPLPIDPPAAGPRPVPDGHVGVLGYLYPGKGHDAVLDALAGSGLPPEVGLVALGAPSTGHADLVAALAARGRDLGRPVTVTGYLDDAALLHRARAVSVPVCAPDKVSASGSVGSWITAGRCPLVVRNPFAEELLARTPGVLTLLAPGPAALAEGIAAALADPDRTWLDPTAPPPPGPGEIARRYAELLAST